MSVTAYMRGNPIYYDGKDWRYADDDTLANDSKPCTKCGHMPTPEGYDYCLGHIDGVSAACCGHGTCKPYYKKESKIK